MINRIIIFGSGDLAKEFVSFANFNECNIKYISKEDELNFNYHDLKNFNKIYIAYSNPELREEITNKIESYNFTPNNYIHPTVIIGKRSIIKDGVIISPNTIISNDVTIEKSCFINCNSNIGHDTIIQKFTSIMTNVNIGGHCKINSKCFLGTGSIIIPKIHITEKTKIGAGSVVIKNIKKSGTYFGNPAKFIL